MYLPQLSPYAFVLGPLRVHWYSLFMALSILAGGAYFVREAERRRLGEDERVFDLALWALVGGIVGARLMFVLANDPLWVVRDPLQILRVYQGGLSWHGALAGGLGGAALYARRHPMRLNPLLDLAVPGVAFGYAVVRIGNIFNHEVLGRMTAFAFGRWPAQLVGAAIGAALLVRYFARERSDLPAGDQWWSFLFYHTLLRAVFEESVRDNPLYLVHYVNPVLGVGFTTLTQLASPVVLAVVLPLWRRALVRRESRAGGAAAQGAEGLQPLPEHAR
ncbi:MAG: prolipoprotein diacylglyceryl transferase [Firmicutes bacterium]|nr:prolipoprotein diacylglyceryl transferase [Bacillota bacterium]